MVIQSKLRLIGLLPTSLLLGLTSYFFIHTYENYSQTTHFVDSLDRSQSIKKVLSEIGKERSITSLYLGTDKTQYHQALTRQRKTTDQSLSALDGKSQMNLKKTLQAARSKVDSANPVFEKIFLRAYTDKLSAPLFMHLLSLNHFDLNVKIASEISMLSQLAIAEENSEKERGFVSYFLSKKIPMSYNDYYRWNTYHTKSQLPDISEANPIRARIDAIIHAKGKGVFVALSKISSAIQIHANKGEYTNNALDWFTLQTHKISLLTQVEKTILDALKHDSNAYRNHQMFLLTITGIIWLISIFLLVVGYIISRDVTFNIQEIEEILSRIMEHTRDDEVAKASDQVHLEKMELSTLKGTRQAYKFLEILLTNAEKNKEKALADNKAKSLSLTNVSYKIRTPLNRIISLTQSLKSSSHTPEQNKFIHAIEEHSGNILTLINGILDSSKTRIEEVEAKRQKPQTETITPTSKEFSEKVYTILIAKKSFLVSRIIEEILKDSHHKTTIIQPIKLLMPSFDFSLYDIIVIDKKMHSNLPKIPSNPVMITSPGVKEVIHQIKSL